MPIKAYREERDFPNQVNSDHLIFLTSVLLTTMFVFSSNVNLTLPTNTSLMLGLGAGSVALVILENFCRKQRPESLLRPTVALEALTERSKQLFSTIGFQIAKLSNVYSFFKEYIAEDLVNIMQGMVNLAMSPLMMLRGYYDYCVKSMTPMTILLTCTAIITAATAYFCRQYLPLDYLYNYFPLTTNITNNNNIIIKGQ